MRRPTLALVAVLALAPPLVAQERGDDSVRLAPRLPTASYRATWWDAPSVAAGGVLGLLPAARGLPAGSAPCAPCDPSQLLAIDRVALHTFSSSASTASSVLLGAGVGLAGLASLDGATAAQVRGHVVVFANSLTWSLAATEWLKVLTHRARPILYVTGAPAAAADVDNRRSLPSGHAALAFAAAATYLGIATREHLPHRARNAIVLFTAALGVAVLRVAAGQHFPTDVAAGAALGTGVGWLTTALHPRLP